MKTKRRLYKKQERRTRKQRTSKNVVGYLEKRKPTKRRKLTKSKFKGAGHCSSKQCINNYQPQLQRPLPPQAVSSPLPQIQTFSLPPSPRVQTPLPQLETSSSQFPQIETSLPPPPPNQKDTLNILIQDKENNMGRMLNVVCKNPDNCLALGVYGSYIKQYFENFRNLSLVNASNIKRIGNKSANGFIIEIPFTKNSFTAYTALKCSAKQNSDNLFYEYYVGKFFINNYLNIFPCFVETYDCYKFNNTTDWSTLKNLTNGNTNNINLTNMITRKQVPENNHDVEYAEMFGSSCEENKNLCVLIQHFDNFRSVKDEDKNNFDNIECEILNILYQVYFPLTILKDVYTHYDLHANNVFLYKPYKGNKYIQMRYHLLSGRIIEFPSEYIVKIIDYGRNYFDNGITNSKTIIKNYVCNNKICEPNCGKNVGYAVIQGDEYNQHRYFHWIFPNKKNISHDLRFAEFFYNFFKNTTSIKKFVYDDRVINGAESSVLYGTAEKLDGDYENIYNIVNLRDFLERFIDTRNGQEIIKKYDATWQKKATMDIYEDKRPYTFVVLPDNV